MGGGGGVSCGTYNFVVVFFEVVGVGYGQFLVVYVFSAPAQRGNMFANDQEKEGRE